MLCRFPPEADPPRFVAGKSCRSCSLWSRIKDFKTMNILAKPVNFINEVRSELSKVSWSTRKELLASTVLVITVTLIMTVFIGIVDLVLSRFLSVVFK